MKSLLVTTLVAFLLSLSTLVLGQEAPKVSKLLSESTKQGQRLLFSEALVSTEPLAALSSRRFDQAVVELRKQGVTVLIMDSVVQGESSKEDYRFLNNATKETLNEYESFYKQANRGVDTVGALFVPPYFDHADQKGTFANVKRAEREKPVLLVAKNSRLSSLFCEYAHHLIHEAAEREPELVNGNMIHSGAVKMAANLAISAQLPLLLNTIKDSKDEETRLGLQRLYGELALTYLENSLKVSVIRHGDSLDATSLLVDFRRELELDTITVTQQAGQFAVSFRKLNSELSKFRTSPEWSSLEALHREGILSPAALDRKARLETQWQVLKAKLDKCVPWFEARRLELLHEVESER